MTLSARDMLSHTTRLAAEMEQAMLLEVKVGLPAETVGTKIYQSDDKSGKSVIEVGAAHEYGVGVPRRSFLRVPMLKNRKDLERHQSELFAKVVDGKTTASLALQRLGVIAENYSRRAFRTMGYGTWKPSRKATGQTMVDTGTLRSSITSVVVKRAS